MGDVERTSIVDLKPRLKSLLCHFIILQKGGPATTTRDGNVINQLLVADNTASINLSVWDDLGDLFQVGDIIRLSNGWSGTHKGSLNLYVGKLGQVKRIGRFNMAYNEFPHMSSFQWMADPSNPENMVRVNNQPNPQPPSGAVALPPPSNTAPSRAAPATTARFSPYQRTGPNEANTQSHQPGSARQIRPTQTRNAL